MTKVFEGLTIQETCRGLKKGDFSLKELVEYYLTQIHDHSHLNAFISVFENQALQKAREIDTKLAQNKAGKLAGAVLAIKDNIAIKDERLTCGSRILENFISLYDATVIRRLLEADAIIIGKTNMDEFAMGSSNENSYFGAVKNPHNPERVPGGSSGGSCVAVAADLVTAALGSDTGGSIRQPSAFCGVVGLKPTYGRVSRFGLVAFASSLDQIGPIGKSVEDTALLLEVMAGHDPRDSTSVSMDVPEFSKYLQDNIKNLKIGLPREYFGQGLDVEIREAIHRLAKFLEKEGATILEISLPHTEYAIATYYILATAEASSNLARYDGAHYGFRDAEATNLEEMYVNSRSQGFGEEVKRRIMLGTYVLSAGYYEAYYRKAQKVRALIKRDFDQAFEQCDCLLTPTTPTTAFKLGEKLRDPLTMYLSDIFTVSVNLAGLPAISIPCGFDSKSLPIGAQLIGRPFDEVTILK
ncbi:MAG: Asp-tRNA(Asn)/Glu-tRNA(Gln) amidotransferase subunit GatA, partial [Calditrichaeota bacterium]